MKSFLRRGPPVKPHPDRRCTARLPIHLPGDCKGGRFLVPTILQPAGCTVVLSGNHCSKDGGLWLRFGLNHSSTTVGNRFVFNPPLSRMVEFWLAFGCNQNATLLLHLHLHINTPYIPPPRRTSHAHRASRDTGAYECPDMIFGLRSKRLDRIQSTPTRPATRQIQDQWPALSGRRSRRRASGSRARRNRPQRDRKRCAELRAAGMEIWQTTPAIERGRRSPARWPARARDARPLG